MSAGSRTAIVVVDAEGRVCLWSSEAQALLGYAASEVCGMPAADLLVSAEDRKAAATARERHPAKDSWNGVLRLRHRDGHALQVALRVHPALTGEGGAGWSVTACEAHQVWQEEIDRAILDGLITQSPLGITVMDADLRYCWMNNAAMRDLTGPAEQLVGRRIGEDQSYANAAEIEQVLRRVRESGEPDLHVQVRGRPPFDPRREHVWSAASFRLTDRAGRVLGVCQTFFDVTEGDRAQRRLALLNEASARIGTTLDVGRTAQELAEAAVPALADIVVVDLLDATVRGEEPAPGPTYEKVLAHRSGACSILSTPDETPEAAFAVGETVTYLPGTPQVRSLAIEQPVLVPAVEAEEPLIRDARRAEKIRAFGIHSIMAVPLRARGITMGMASFSRYRQLEPFDEEDLALAEEFASLAAVCIDNARRYTREHTTVLALQHSLLPHDLPRHPAAETAYRYLPAVAHAGAGGDWFDVLPLSGARMALVVGDVTGHGLHAAAVMGRLRTAVHTLADLDLTPAEVLTQLDDLVIRLVEEDPGCEGATCLYTVYDPISRICAFARAGHPPPTLVSPDGTAVYLDIPAGPPLGTGGQPFEVAELQLAEGTLLALYTNGLINASGPNAAIGLAGLARALADPGRPLEELCDATVGSLLPEPHSEDATLLLARTRALGAQQVASWDLPTDPSLVAHARTLAADQLSHWDLESLAFTTELVVSELVTNAIRYARAPIALRLIHTDALICEVSDGSLSAPHLRRARATDEGGRGLFLIAQLTSRWGTRYHPDGKTIWTEQPLP
ncbi:SpoIIE family protein phosphatase [Streptomyces sp. NPDC004752]